MRQQTCKVYEANTAKAMCDGIVAARQRERERERATKNLIVKKQEWGIRRRAV